MCKKKKKQNDMRKIEITIIVIFAILVPTADNYVDLYVSGRLAKVFPAIGAPIAGKYVVNITNVSGKDEYLLADVEPQPQYLYSVFTFLPVLVSFLFTVQHWRKREDSLKKKLITLPLLILQVWPQSIVCKMLYHYKNDNEGWKEEKSYYERELSTIEAFLEAIPQVLVLLCISFLSGFTSHTTEYGPECPTLGCAITCAPQNCGLVGNILEPWNDKAFFATLLLSIIAASFGMGRFVRKGPMTLVPRKTHGISFFFSIFIPAISLMSKAALLGLLMTSHGLGMGKYYGTVEYVSYSLTWIGINVLPNFLYAIFLASWTAGVKRTFDDLLPRYPGIFLLPVFGLFTFGPRSHQKSQGKCCKCPGFGENDMKLSFRHTYINLLISVGGSALTEYLLRSKPSFSDPKEFFILSMITISIHTLQFFSVILFQCLEKSCCIECCCSCCMPFTERSVLFEHEEQQENEGNEESNRTTKCYVFDLETYD